MRMNRLLVASIGFALLWVLTPAVGGDSLPEVILFEGTTDRPFEAPGVYPRVYSGRVVFQHGKHFSGYGATCGDCHHADSFDSDTETEPDIEITPCVGCHDEPGLVLGRRVDEMDAGDLVTHRANVIHQLCVGCHEGASASNRAIVAPIACRGCHAQRQKDYELTDSADS